MRHHLPIIVIFTLLFTATACDSGSQSTSLIVSVDTVFWTEPGTELDTSMLHPQPQESPATEQAPSSTQSSIDFHPATVSPSHSSSGSRSESAYDLGYRNGYDDGYDDAISGNDPNESPTRCPYSSRHLIAEYERGYRSGYYDGYHEAWDEAKEDGEDLEEW